MTFKTIDYDQFKKIDSNRPVNHNHVETLMRSIKTRNMLEFRPILVNSKMEVVDGQHRLEAAKRLGIEVWYQINKSAKVEDVMHLNLAQKNWGISDYVNYYAQSGNEDYKKLSSFSDKYKMKNASAARLLTARTQSGGGIGRNIKEGKFVYPKDREIEKRAILVIQSAQIAIDIMRKKCLGDKLFLLATKFREALEDFIARDDVDFERLMSKIELRTDALCKRTGYGGYMDMLKAIYNYRNQEPIP